MRDGIQTLLRYIRCFTPLENDRVSTVVESGECLSDF